MMMTMMMIMIVFFSYLLFLLFFLLLFLSQSSIYFSYQYLLFGFLLFFFKSPNISISYFYLFSISPFSFPSSSLFISLYTFPINIDCLFPFLDNLQHFSLSFYFSSSFLSLLFLFLLFLSLLFLFLLFLSPPPLFTFSISPLPLSTFSISPLPLSTSSYSSIYFYFHFLLPCSLPPLFLYLQTFFLRGRGRECEEEQGRVSESKGKQGKTDAWKPQCKTRLGIRQGICGNDVAHASAG